VRHQFLDGDELPRSVGAAVVRATEGGVVLDLGPADGAPQVRISLTEDEATRLSRALQAVANGKDEEILIVPG
jgi:hypothetical protein